MRKLGQDAAAVGVVGALAVAAIVTFFAVAADSSLYADGALDAYIEAHAFMLNALGAR